jgi:hypothetical protein
LKILSFGNSHIRLEYDRKTITVSAATVSERNPMNEITTTSAPLATEIEKVLIGGDLAQLNPEQRLSYYNTLCLSLGLSPLTQPFQYIVLNGKLQLYAKKDCTEQLRKIHGVSITKVDPKQIGDLVVVVADAADREGRVDSSTGAVAVKGVEGKDAKGTKFKYDLTGENLANAMMKCETKAKRRVTLSICGLGMLDETEVQTLREQGVAQEPQGNNWQAPNPTTPTTQMDPKPNTGSGNTPTTGETTPSAISHPTGEPDIQPRSRKGTPQAQQSRESPFPPQQEAIQGEVVGAEPSITAPQAKRFFAIGRSAGLNDEQVKQALASIGYHGHRDEMPKRIYEAAVDAIDPQFKFHQSK